MSSAGGLGGQRNLVVGGGSGIGFAVAEAVLSEGAQVLIASTRRDRLEAAAARLGEGARWRELDITEESAVQRFFADEGRFDHVVTTAGDWGGPRGQRLSDLDLAEAHGLFRVRFWGALTLAKFAAPAIGEGGSFTFTDGMISERPGLGSAISSAMAGAVEHLAQGLAVELAPVRVNCVCPGFIRTEIWNARMSPDAVTETLSRMTARQPLKRAGEPAEVAQAYLYAMKAGYTTGQVLRVDGGLGRI